jgi:hypothetical protein
MVTSLSDHSPSATFVTDTPADLMSEKESIYFVCRSGGLPNFRLDAKGKETLPKGSFPNWRYIVVDAEALSDEVARKAIADYFGWAPLEIAIERKGRVFI